MSRPTLCTLLLLAAAPLAQEEWVPTGTLVPGSGYGLANRYFGGAMTTFHDWALVGAPGVVPATVGEAHVFEWVGSQWSGRAILAPSGSEGIGDFGRAVALTAGSAVVGAPGRGLERGSVFVFEGADDTWPQAAQLRGPVSEDGDRLGRCLALDGDVLLAGAPGAGRVEVFERGPSGWSHAQTLEPPGQSAAFGYAVALEQTTAVVGDPSQRSAFVYRRQGSVWGLDAILTDASGVTGELGVAVALAGGVIAVGAPHEASYEDDLDGSGQHGQAVGSEGQEQHVGAVHESESSEVAAVLLFERSSGAWNTTAVLAPLQPSEHERFGSSVALSGDHLVVGSPDEEDLDGHAFVYRRIGTGWIETFAAQVQLGYEAKGRFANYVGFYGQTILTNIGLDEVLPFGFYGGAILIWTLQQVDDPGPGTATENERPSGAGR